MGVELYTQQSIFNAGLSSMEPISQMKNPSADNHLITKEYFDTQFEKLSTLPFLLPVASSSVLGGVKQGIGVDIDSNGSISVSGYEAVTWVKDNSSTAIVIKNNKLTFNTTSTPLSTTTTAGASVGYIVVELSGTAYKIPYYNV
jgi:hypothetical protein